MSETIPDPIQAAARAHPDQPAILGPDATWTYAELERRVEQAARALARSGVTIGNRVATYLPRTPEHIILLMAALRCGAVIAPLSTRLPREQVPDRLAQISADCLITDEKDIRVPASVPRPSSEDFAESDVGSVSKTKREWMLDRPATIIFTSGSTGTPKAALHTWGNHYFNAKGARTNIALASGDRWLLSLPLYHVGGLAILFRCWWAGACVVLPVSGAPLHDSIDAHGITHVSLVATQLQRLLRTERPFDSLRAVLVGGGPIPAGLLTEAHARGWPVHTTYGCTEMTSQVTTTPPGAAREILTTAGRILPHRELCISGTGEILVRGPTLFRGYLDGDDLHDPRDAEGWYHTGDRGTLDEDGCLHIHGRTDHLFISGGENIHPEEIERVLTQLDGIARAVVVPIPDEEFGARPVAFVDANREEIAPADLVTQLEARLPRFKIPVRFFPWPDEVERGGMKIDRDAFQKRAQARQA